MPSTCGPSLLTGSDLTERFGVERLHTKCQTHLDTKSIIQLLSPAGLGLAMMALTVQYVAL